MPYESLRLPLPTKDELALVNQHPLTLNDFLIIREQLHDKKNEDALWIGISALALHGATSNQLDKMSAYTIARYALKDISLAEAEISLKQYYRSQQNMPSPDEVKKELDGINQKAQVMRNPVPLSSY